MRLQEAGFPVPAFVSITADDTRSAEEIAREAQTVVAARSYAVRSSAGNEDGANASMAGQYLTLVDVKAPALAEAITRVRASAGSFIVQEFIEPDVAGVTFTRHPTEGRETVIEYVRGRGEVLVSGARRGTRFAFYRSAIPKEVPGLPALGKVLQTFLEIERVFGSPQDIEWCVKNGQWFCLQSRPITTRDSTAEDHFLDEHLPRTPFCFKKTGACEIAPRPTPLTRSLLAALYTQDGPVARAYQRLGVPYEPADPFVIVGNELYVDQERELHALFPSMTTLKDPYGPPQANGLRGVWKTMRAMVALKNSQVPGDTLMLRASSLLHAPARATDLSTALACFLDAYETVFLINIEAERALSRVRPFFPTEAALAKGLAAKTAADGAVFAWQPPQGLRGNSMELSDESPFSSADVSWKGAVPAGVPESLLISAQITARLREYGRWIAQHYLQPIRRLAREKHGEDAWFYTWEELVGGKTVDVSARKQAFQEGDRYVLPTLLCHLPPTDQKSQAYGVSSGRAEGRLVRVKDAGRYTGPLVVLTDVLGPDLASLPKNVVGVLSGTGGLLSHYAIIARERGIPVLVGMTGVSAALGKRISLDADAARWEVLGE